MPGIAGQHAREPFIGLARAVRHDHHAGMQRIADADAAAVMDRNPGGAGRGVEQRVEDRPVGDRVAAVAHAFGLAIRRRHRSGIEMIAADHDRRLDPSLPHQLVDASIRSARDRRTQASRSAPAIPGTRRARAPGGSSGTAPRRPQTSRARPRRSRECRRDLRRAPPSGTGLCPRRRAAAHIPARSRECQTRFRRPLAAPARECCCRNRTSPRRALAARASLPHAVPSTASTRSMYSSGSRSRSSERLGKRHAVGDVAIERVVRRRLIGQHVRHDAARGPVPAARLTHWPRAPIDRAMPSRAPVAATRRQRIVEARRRLVEIPRLQPALDPPRIDFDDQRRRAVHRRGERLRAAHAAEAGRDRRAGPLSEPPKWRRAAAANVS